jgi:hypothetical protein
MPKPAKPSPKGGKHMPPDPLEYFTITGLTMEK